MTAIALATVADLTATAVNGCLSGHPRRDQGPWSPLGQVHSLPGHRLLAEAQVDKVSAEVLAPVSGVVNVRVEQEAFVRQGTQIVRIEA